MMEWSRESKQYRWNLRSFEKALREQPSEIHWPTAKEPWTSWPREMNLIVKNRRRNFVITSQES